MTEQDAVIAYLAQGAQRIDTQGAVVLLKGDEAIKIRRAILLPFLDYSTLEKRRAAAQAEIALNQPYAPHIYKDSGAIRRTRDGFGFEGDGEIVEWATRMRRFDTDATLDKVAARGALSREAIVKLAGAIRAMHAKAKPCKAGPAMAAMGKWIGQNAESFSARPDLFATDAVNQLTQQSQAALSRAAPLLTERGARGFVRRCHGDLHLGNIVLIDGEPTPFDAIEFDDEIATGDILYDLAFTVMDLWERDFHTHANRLLNAYLDASNYDALALLPLFLSLRAAIRAKVEANAAEHLDNEKRAQGEASARRYFEFACRFLQPKPPVLVVVGGLSGSGKSALSGALAADIGMAPGAIWLRSDVERKAMFGVEPTTKLDAQAYSAAASAQVHARLIDKARRVLAAGAGVLIDATHAHAPERTPYADMGVPFIGLWLEAPLATRLARIAARRGDASDADEAVARAQCADPLTEAGWRAIDASGDLATTLRDARVATSAGAGI